MERTPVAYMAPPAPPRVRVVRGLAAAAPRMACVVHSGLPFSTRSDRSLLVILGLLLAWRIGARTAARIPWTWHANRARTGGCTPCRLRFPDTTLRIAGTRWSGRTIRSQPRRRTIAGYTRRTATEGDESARATATVRKCERSRLGLLLCAA